VSESSVTVQLRPAGEQDIAALVALEEVSFSTDQLAARNFRKLLRAGNCALTVAYADAGDGQSLLAGYVLVLFRRNTSVARIYSIAVAAPFRGKRIGAALLAAAESAARQAGSRVIRLEVRPDNVGAIALYENQGYRRFAVVTGFYEDGCDALRLEKVL